MSCFYSSSSTAGYICGRGTVSNCWRLPNAGKDPDNNTNVNYIVQGRLLSIGSKCTAYPVYVSGSTYTKKAWTDITSLDINGLGVDGAMSASNYLSSTSDNSSTLTVPDYIEGGTPNTTSSTQTTTSFTVAYRYKADHSTDIYVSKKAIEQANLEVTYDAQTHELPAPTSPSITEGGYWYNTLYYDNSSYNTLGTTSRTNAGKYYTITDIKLGGQVVGRKIGYSSNAVLEIKQKALSVSYSYSPGWSSYIYNAKHQGVVTATISGFAGSESSDS